MTTIHYTPPPDDAPEEVLAWSSAVPNRWISRESKWVRHYWGKPWAAWCEQPPLPTPEPEPVVADDVISMAWGLIANAHNGQWSEATDEWREAAQRWRDDYYHRWLDGRPVCLPDEPDEDSLSMQTHETIVAEATSEARRQTIDEVLEILNPLPNINFARIKIKALAYGEADDPPAEADPAPVDRPTAEAIVKRTWRSAAEACERALTNGFNYHQDSAVVEKIRSVADRAPEVDLSDLPAPVDRQTAEVIVERFVNVLQAEADSARARYPQDSPAIRHGTAALDHGIRALRSVDLSDLPDPAKSYTAEQIERAFRGEGANDAEIVPLLAALRDGEDTP